MSGRKRHPIRIPHSALGIRAQERTLKARSWWARGWIYELEALGMGPRLGRGRQYALQGQVTELVLDGPQVHASVVGSRDAPYKVDVLFEELDVAPFEKMLRENPMLLARVLVDDLPTEFDPFTKLSFKAHCSCPDWHHPCKHVAAVMFLLGEAVARRPALLLSLRGLDVEALLPPEDAAARKTKVALPSVRLDANSSVDPAIILKRLGPIPFWRGHTRCVDALSKIYERAARAAADDQAIGAANRT